MATRRLRIGILGAAKIARQFVAATRASEKIEMAAVAARDVERARGFAAETGVPTVHATYEALLADPSIEAIYNPLPNNLHAEWSIRAANAGKHVLCEKPLAATGADARAIFDAAKKNGVFVVEGYPYRAQPQTAKLNELLADNAIGRLQLVHASFGFPLSDAANIRMVQSLAGGALMDAGSYPVSFVRMVAGERPRRVHALARWADTGVDRALIASLEFASGLLAQASCSFSTARHRRAFIVGDGGTIETNYFNDTSAALPPMLLVRKGVGYDTPVEAVSTQTASGFLSEADAFCDLVRHGWSRWTGATPEESIDIALTLDALAASARSGEAVEVT